METFPAGSAQVNVLFSGEKMEDGLSWCSDCEKAAPFIKQALTQAPVDSHLIHVDVGGRAYWKDMNCPFRKDKNTHLSVIPTLIRWKSPQRLEGDAQLCKADLLEMFFQDDD
jgi:Eukaryotic protein of unknown function (DUF953)